MGNFNTFAEAKPFLENVPWNLPEKEIRKRQNEILGFQSLAPLVELRRVTNILDFLASEKIFKKPKDETVDRSGQQAMVKLFEQTGTLINKLGETFYAKNPFLVLERHVLDEHKRMPLFYMHELGSKVQILYLNDPYTTHYEFTLLFYIPNEKNIFIVQNSISEKKKLTKNALVLRHVGIELNEFVLKFNPTKVDFITALNGFILAPDNDNSQDVRHSSQDMNLVNERGLSKYNVTSQFLSQLLPLL